MKRFLFVCFVVLLSTSVWSQNKETLSVHQSHYTTDYALYAPVGYDQNEAVNYPLILFLHGAGGSSVPAEVVVNILSAKEEYWPNYNAFVVAPVCHEGVNWEPLILNKMLKEILATYHIDQDRVYLTGPSMGGYGTWRWASENPELFAAVAPVCGGGNPDNVWAMRNLPIWASHGEDDDVVLCSESIHMIDALKAMGANPKFDVYPGVKHNAWDKIYYSTAFYDWLFSQRRQPMPSIEIPAAEMDQYVGTYRLPWTGFVNINKVDGRLQVELTLSGQKMDLLSDAPGRFYVANNRSNMILFTKSSDGKVESMNLYGGDHVQVGHKVE